MQLLRGVFLFGSTLFNFLALNTLQLAEDDVDLLLRADGHHRARRTAARRVGRLAALGGDRRRLRRRAGHHAARLAAFEIGHVYALCATLSYCLYVIMTRRMTATESAESLIFYSALAPVVMMLPVVPFTASLPPDAFHWLVLLSLGLFGGFGHWLLINAYKQATTTALAPYPYMQMVWMIGFGYPGLRPVSRSLDDGRRGDHRRQRPLYRPPRAPAEAAEPHGTQRRGRATLAKKL